MVQGHGSVAGLGHIVRAVLGANWHLSTRLLAGGQHPPTLYWQQELQSRRLSQGLVPSAQKALCSSRGLGRLWPKGDPTFLPGPCPELCRMNRWVGPGS